MLLNYLRGLADTLPGTDSVSEMTIESLEEIQNNVATIYADYEDNPAPTGAETLRELMMEALHLIHQGIEEFLLFSDDLLDEHLTTGLAMTEEGHDIMESIRYAIAQDQNWTSSAAVH